nr:uncharacterized protein LOC120363929 [Saimiri boliviensis boliviensis]
MGARVRAWNEPMLVLEYTRACAPARQCGRPANCPFAGGWGRPWKFAFVLQVFCLFPSPFLQRPRACSAWGFPDALPALSESRDKSVWNTSGWEALGLRAAKRPGPGSCGLSGSGRRGRSRHCGAGRADGRAPAAAAAAAAASMLQRGAQLHSARRPRLPAHAALGSPVPRPAWAAATAPDLSRSPSA